MAKEKETCSICSTELNAKIKRTCDKCGRITCDQETCGFILKQKKAETMSEMVAEEGNVIYLPSATPPTRWACTLCAADGMASLLGLDEDSPQ